MIILSPCWDGDINLLFVSLCHCVILPIVLVVANPRIIFAEGLRLRAVVMVENLAVLV
jgi:hypothetical protein